MRIYEDLKQLQTRLGILQSVLVTLMLLLAVHFWRLQVLKGRQYVEAAENNRVRSVNLAAPRGMLLDRKGRVRNSTEHGVLLTKAGIDYETGLTDKILHRSNH